MSGSQQTRSQVMRYALQTKSIFTADEAELYELAMLAGVTIDPSVFKIITDLLKLNVAPAAIERMLKSMTATNQKRRPTTTDGHDSVGSSAGQAGSQRSSRSRATPTLRPSAARSEQS